MTERVNKKMKERDVDMKTKASLLSGTQSIGMKNIGSCRTSPGVVRGKASIAMPSKDWIRIHEIRMPELNLNEARTLGLWKQYKHRELSFISPMPFEENVKIIQKLMPYIAEGHVFDEEMMMRGAAEYDGKPVKLGFVLSEIGSKSVCNVVMYDMDDQCIGFPSTEQITWMNNQQNK